jgi:tetratricopeptide (TPR) repeat protein
MNAPVPIFPNKDCRMTDFSSVSIPPPSNWQDFERNTRLMFEYSLRDPHTQNNGRQGQAQHGVDVFGRRGGGNGPLVGVQCKGKDADYGEAVTEAELYGEVRKSESFKPPLREFILATTAPDDAKIQETARLLELEVRGAGRDLAISVWGWGRIKQEIVRYPEVLKAFHPDATPFSDRIFAEFANLKDLINRTGISPGEPALTLARAPSAPAQIAADSQSQPDALDKFLQGQIDTYRDLIRDGRPQTAIEFLTKLREQAWGTASPRARFRILTNTGAAHHRLGHFDEAADCFLEAAPFSTDDDPVCLANKIAALLIKGRTEEANALGSETFGRFPGNSDIAMQRLQARAPDESIGAAWTLLAPSLKENVKLLMYRATALRDEQDSAWRDVVAEAIRLHPDDAMLKVLQAEGVLEKLLKADPSAVGGAGDEVPTQDDLMAAADAFESVWAATLRGEAHPGGAFAHNAALVRHFLRQDERAGELLDEAFAAGYGDDEAKRLRISLYMRAGNTPQAIGLADRLEESPRARIIQADLRIPDASAEARDILAGRDQFTDPRDIVAAAWVVVDSFLAEGKYDGASKEAQRLTACLPSDPHSFLAQHTVKRARGDADAREALSQAVGLLTGETAFGTRFFVADALGKAKRFDEAVDVLRDHTSTCYDSVALRTLVAAAANSDRRATLKQLLDSLPEPLLQLPFYRHAKLRLAVKSGDVKAAVREIRAGLSLRPRDLELQIQLMHLLFRENRIVELREQARRPATDFDGSPEDIMHLAQLKEAFGDWRDAYQLAYATLLTHRGSPEVNLGYVSVFLRPGHSKELDISPSIVAENAAVAVRWEDGGTKVYVIETDPGLRPTPDYLPPDHKVAGRFIGKGVGAEILFPDNTKGTIEWIKPKVLHELHETLDNFQMRFPEAPGLERVLIRPGPGGLAPVLDRVRGKHDATEQVARLYDAGNFPIAVASRMLGLDPVETLVGFISTGHRIHVCVGTHEERQFALSSIRDNGRKGCVVDALTLHILRRVGLADVVRSICGPIGITDATALATRHKIHKLKERIDEPDMSLSWRDGEYFRDEISSDQKREALAALEEDDEWITRHAEILPAQGTRDPSAQVRELLEVAGSNLVDDILAAEGSGRIFLSEDQALRAVAATEFSVASTWLQPVLMLGVHEGCMSRQKYAEVLTVFVDSKLEFISVDADTLVQTLRGVQSHSLPAAFSKLGGRLGGKNADMLSHLGVAVRTITATWHEASLSATVRQAVVGTLLYQLSKERPLAQFAGLLGGFAELGQRLRDPRFVEYLDAWARGHFIDIRRVTGERDKGRGQAT